jgi:hypothetical protein
METQTNPEGQGLNDSKNKYKQKKHKKNDAKRFRFIDSDESDEQSESNRAILAAMWPRYLVVHATDPMSPLNKLSPFAVYKAIKGIAGEPEDVTRMRSGDLIIKVTRKSHSDNLLKTTRMVEVPVQVSPHMRLNTVKGIIRSVQLLETREEEILEELQSQGVTGVRRIKARREGVLQNTAAIILTFGLTVLPTHIKCGWMRLPVDLYIPNPLRCFQCQRFGHHRANCRRKETCARCGTEGHGDRGCEEPARCINCKGNHSAFSRNCPQWKKEQEIQRVRTQNNLTFPEARRRVEANEYRPPTARTFSQVVGQVVDAKITRTIGVQTTITWPDGEGIKPSMIERSNEVDTGSQTNVRLGMELITPSTKEKQQETGTKPKQAATSPTKKKKQKFRAAKELGNVGSASVADKGRFDMSKSLNDPQRKIVGKKIDQIRQGGNVSHKASETTSAKSASEQVKERKKRPSEEKEAMEVQLQEPPNTNDSGPEDMTICDKFGLSHVESQILGSESE